MARWSQETKVGLFLIVGTAGIIALVIGSGDFTFEQTDMVGVNVEFDSISSGLVPGAPVKLAGVEIGRVKDIQLMEGTAKVSVTLEVEERRVRQGDSACIATMGLLGDKYLCIIPGGVEEEFVATGGYIDGDEPVQLEDMIALGKQISEDLREAISTFNTVFGADETQESIQETIRNARDTSRSVRDLAGQLADTLEENRPDLRAGVANLREASELLKGDVHEGLQDIDKLIADLDGMVAENRRDVRETVANFRGASETLKVFSRQLEDKGLLGVARGLDPEKTARWPWDGDGEP